MKFLRTFLSGTVPAILVSLAVLAYASSTVCADDQLETQRRAEAAEKRLNWTEAAAAWQHVVESNPHLGRAWLSLGTALYRNKHYREAIPAFTRAFELRATYPFRPSYSIACCYAQLGEKERALTWLQKALDHGFRSLRQIQLERDLQCLHDNDRFKKMVGLVDVTTLSRDAGWRFDLELLAREMKRTHYSPFRQVSRAQFDAYVHRLSDEIPHLTDNQIVVGFMKLLRLVGDGHTALADDALNGRLKERVPAEFYLFEEGLFITRIDPRFADLAGAQVTLIDGHTIDQVMQGLDSVIPQDNAMGLRWHGPEAIRSPRILNGLGVASDPRALLLKVRDTAGHERDITLPADAGEPGRSWVSARLGNTDPLYLKKRKTFYWFEYLSEPKLVYFQYNAVADQGLETIEKFCKRLFTFIANNDVGKLVIDMRWNGGGNNFLNEPLIHGLIRCDKINQPGRLFVIVGRNTFSAAMCGVTQIERHTKAIFVGEPTGSSPNFVGESAVIVNLPYSKLRASVSDLYWQNSVAMDYRSWIAPAIYTPPTFASFRANRDPALEAILAHQDKK
jgi:hypothetical protein